MIRQRDNRDNGANFELILEGLQHGFAAHDPRAGVIARLAYARSTPLPHDSLLFATLTEEAEAAGDSCAVALGQIALARALIFDGSDEDVILEQLEACIDAAGAALDAEVDLQVADVLGSYANIAGCLGAARHAFEIGLDHDAAPGDPDAVITRLNLASVEIMAGDLDTARSHFLAVEPHIDAMRPAVRGFGQWIAILSAPSIDHLTPMPLSDTEAQLVRRRAIRRFLINDMTGIVTVEECIHEITAGLPRDAATGLVPLDACRSLLEESVAIGVASHLASIRIPHLLPALARLTPEDASSLMASVHQRLTDAHKTQINIAQIDLDHFVALSDASEMEFETAIHRIIDRLSLPLQPGSGNTPIRLQPAVAFARTGEGDTALRVWNRLLSSPARRGNDSINLADHDHTEDEQIFTVAQELLADDIGDHAMVAFQPLVDASSNRVTGFESLLRWHSPSLGPVPPPIVIEAAQACGALGRLEAHIAETAIAGAARLHQIDDRVRVNVNLTPTGLSDEAIGDTIAAACTAHAVPSNRIGIEITESALVDWDLASPAFDALASRGFVMMLDDFGTGYSNLAYLVELQNVGLKIDGSFVRGALDHDRARAVCEIIIAAALAVDAPLVAEQVETVEQAEFLIERGCAVHQGHLYAAAMPIDDAVQWLSYEQSDTIGS